MYANTCRIHRSVLKGYYILDTGYSSITLLDLVSSNIIKEENTGFCELIPLTQVKLDIVVYFFVY
jgi:hypothetical protein